MPFSNALRVGWFFVLFCALLVGIYSIRLLWFSSII